MMCLPREGLGTLSAALGALGALSAVLAVD